MRFVELKLSHGSGAQHKAPWDLRQILHVAIGNGFYNRAVRDGAKRVARLKHGQFFTSEGEEFAALLFVFADSEHIDASYEKMATGQVRTLEKEDGEGYRTEAHLVIRLSPEMRGDFQVYAAALEESPGLGTSVVLSRIHNPLHRAGKREGKDVSGNIVTWYPVIEMDGLLSKSLIQEIERGELDGFELVKEHLESGGIDETETLVRKRQVLSLDIRQDPSEGAISGLISRARQIAFDENYERVRIHYKEAGTGRLKSAVLDVEPDADDPAEPIANLVSRTKMLTLGSRLNYDHSEVVISLAEAMAKTLTEELSESE